jgi:uncharacterized protein
MRRTLILFVRQPRLGAGKSRLARDIGALAALKFERLMLTRSLARLGRDRRWRLRLAITPDPVGRKSVAPSASGRRDIGGLPPAFRRGHPPYVVSQGRGDLGERMRRAMARYPPGPVVLIGTDIPGMTPDHIAQVFALLGRHDIVFGPATDGGFWLVGCRHRPPVFGRVRWSTRHALEDALANLPKSLSVGFAATLDDVDDGAAYRRLASIKGF